MVNKNQLLRRLLALLCLLLLCAGLAAGQLVQLQLINGGEYVKRAATFLTTTSTVSAARGEILDRFGRPMVTNKTAFSMVLVHSSWQQEGQYERLLDLAHRVQQDGGTLCDILPVSQTAPYTYMDVAGGDLNDLSDYIKKSRETLGLDTVKQAVADAEAKQKENPRYNADGEVIDEVSALDATELVSADEFVRVMRTYLEEKKGMPAGLSEADARTMVGLYYSMRQMGFATRVNFTLATDISIDLIAYLKEHHQQYSGVEIETDAVRRYDTKLAAHLLGTVGTMWATEWTGTENGGPYRDKPGYNMNDTIGKTGLEAALEPYLHGTAGSRTVDTSYGGDTVSEQTSGYAPVPGDNVITTINLDLQQTAEQSLEENLAQYGRGAAAVALDPNTGEVLAMASYPTFDLETYDQDTETYNQLLEDPRHVFINRATSGVYPPGSTFKVLTSIAA
ncbi:MAG: penicillin-binding transpeptidase domain-containing protein, partial [Agathobaculum sp.]|uniref:penicillin-binding transpeptidase domain-containing protein n=1 Tax=Agathobaculum sp. TaxID=2048138 RepID=UPI003D9413F2